MSINQFSSLFFIPFKSRPNLLRRRCVTGGKFREKTNGKRKTIRKLSMLLPSPPWRGAGGEVITPPLITTNAENRIQGNGLDAIGQAEVLA